ncbi:MAG: methyl-accepting chemotaxis protein, partial [Rhodospirillaceae bacterium]|nr:methyl-accepting chemotaxis protein [Rhodospirillaceae bacterium]
MGLKVGHRIIAGFAIVIVLTLGLGWYELSNVRRMSDLSSHIVEEDFDTLRLLRQIGNTKRHEALLLEQAWTAYLLGKAGVPAKDPAVFENEWTLSVERHRGLVGDLEKWSDEQEQEAGTEARRTLLRQLGAVAKSERENLEDTVTTGKALFALLQSGALTQFPAHYEVLQRLRDESSAAGARAEDLIVQLASNAKQRILDLEQGLREVSLPVLVGVLVLGLVVAFLIYRSIATPLAEFMRFVERVGAGDLTRSLTRVGRDEIGRLGGHLNAMVASLSEVARQTRAATENLNAAAAEMQASVQQHAAGASEQNAAIQQITTTLTEIT